MNIQERLDYHGLTQKVAKTKLFKATGTFDAVEKARKSAERKGYKIGSMSRNEPMALSKKANYIAKWYNISRDEYHKIEGVLLSDDFREGDVWFVEFEKE